MEPYLVWEASGNMYLVPVEGAVRGRQQTALTAVGRRGGGGEGHGTVLGEGGDA